MIFVAKNKKRVELRKLHPGDFEDLIFYFQNLSDETKSRFGPHNFNLEGLEQLYKGKEKHFGFIAQETDSGNIVAYSVIKKGFLEHDSFRLESYGLKLNQETDCAFAPSVSDVWQGQGVGEALFDFITHELKTEGFARIILWGGVQASNEKALAFYRKLGFTTLGNFEYNGWNYDMKKEIA